MSVQRYIVTFDGLEEDDIGVAVMYSDYAALEARCAGLERERDDFHDTLMRMAAYIGHDMSDGADHSGLLDDVIRLDKERDALQAKIDSARTSIDKICAEYRQRTNELDSLQVQHKQALDKREELKSKLAAAEEALREIYNGLVEINPNNHDEDDVFTQNNSVIESIQIADAILAGHAPATPQADHIADTSKKVQAAPSDREKRLEDLAVYVGSDLIIGQLTRIFGSNQRELVELRRLLAALADTTTDEVQP